MTRLLIQDYLAFGGTLAALDAEHAVKHRRHKDYPNLVCLKYKEPRGLPTDPDFTSEMIRECRGIVLDEADEWRVVSRAFDKFANLGESYADVIDWSTASVQEKLDGSLCVLYTYAGKWHVATSGSPDASGTVQAAGVHPSLAVDTGMSFADYFWRTFEAAGGQLPLMEEFDEFCFAFELMGPLNRVIVVHREASIRLIGVRDRETGKERRPSLFKALLNVPAAQWFPLMESLDDVRASFDTMSPVTQEGYVVVDAAFRRVKIKHPKYVELHHAKDGFGPKAFVEIARGGEIPEVVASFPEFEGLIADARAKYDALVVRCVHDFARISSISSPKDFAAEAQKAACPAAMFQARKGVLFRDFFRSVPIDKLMNWIRLAETP